MLFSAFSKSTFKKKKLLRLQLYKSVWKHVGHVAGNKEVRARKTGKIWNPVKGFYVLGISLVPLPLISKTKKNMSQYNKKNVDKNTTLPIIPK